VAGDWRLGVSVTTLTQATSFLYRGLEGTPTVLYIAQNEWKMRKLCPLNFRWSKWGKTKLPRHGSPWELFCPLESNIHILTNGLYLLSSPRWTKKSNDQCSQNSCSLLNILINMVLFRVWKSIVMGVRSLGLFIKPLCKYFKVYGHKVLHSPHQLHWWFWIRCALKLGTL